MLSLRYSACVLTWCLTHVSLDFLNLQFCLFYRDFKMKGIQNSSEK